MNTEIKTVTKTIEGLTEWIKELIEEAKADTPFAVCWFKENDYDAEPFCIVGGWSEGFSEDYADLLYISKSSPKYAMCVKIVVNEGPCVCADFDYLKMPIGTDGYVDDTCVTLERGDDPSAVAMFFWSELERINKEHENDEE